jgi:hypothetical protein
MAPGPAISGIAKGKGATAGDAESRERYAEEAEKPGAAEPCRHQDGERDERGAKGNLAALVLAHAVGHTEKEGADQDGIGDDEKCGECRTGEINEHGGKLAQRASK